MNALREFVGWLCVAAFCVMVLLLAKCVGET